VNRTGRKEVSIVGVHRLLGHWRLFQLTMGRNTLDRHGKHYGCANAAIGPYPVAQLHAWVNTESRYGAYWQFGRGRRQMVVSALRPHIWLGESR
jgi:hypothetical protein